MSWFCTGLTIASALHSAYNHNRNGSNPARSRYQLHFSPSWPYAAQQRSKHSSRRNGPTQPTDPALPSHLAQSPPCPLLGLTPPLAVITPPRSKQLCSPPAVVPQHADHQKQCFLRLLVQFSRDSLLHFRFWYYKADTGAKVASASLSKYIIKIKILTWSYFPEPYKALEKNHKAWFVSLDALKPIFILNRLRESHEKDHNPQKLSVNTAPFQHTSSSMVHRASSHSPEALHRI